jgi:hypothetical protein
MAKPFPWGFICSTLLMLGGLSCVSEYSVKYGKEKPYTVFEACRLHVGEPNLGPYAFAATVLALDENSWVIEEISREKGTVKAKKCLRPTICASMIFHPYNSGAVAVYTQEGSALASSLLDDMSRWSSQFEQSFSKFSCYKLESLRELMVHFDIEF